MQHSIAEPITSPDDQHGIVLLGSAGASAVDVVGGKGARLTELIKAGLPVPPGFCIPTSVLARFLRETGLDEQARTAAGPELRQQVAGSPVPESIAAAILAAYAALGRPRVAVRSSALQEDSAARSFAGQHDTLLDVAGDEALLVAVTACWASLWSDRAAAYRPDSADAGSMAVVVQQMVDADASGVLFTVDPTGGRPGHLVIEACWGLGEGLVAGRVPSDLYVVDPETRKVVEQLVRYKVTRYAAVEPGRVGMVKVDPADRARPCLTPEQAAELAGLALRIRDREGAEQDVEWVLKDGVLALLQTRPVTTTPSRPSGRTSPYVEPQPEPVRQGTLWSRMDIGEIFTGPMSPLGQSFAQYYQRAVHAGCAAATGVRDTGDVGLQMGYLQGHVYLNISYTSYMLGQCVPTRDQRRFTRRFASEEVDLAGYTNPFGRFPGGLEGLRSTVFWLRHTGLEMRRMTTRADRMVSSRYYEFDRARAMDLTRLSRRELNTELTRRLAYFHDMHVGYMPYYINAFGFYGLVTELFAKWLGHAGDNLQNRVKTDMSSLRTVQSATEMWTLAQQAAARPRVLRIIRETALPDVRAALLADEDGREFWAAAMEPFLRTNGTRGRQEMELTHPRWIDDPSYIFQMIRRYAADGRSVPDMVERHGADAETDRQDAASVLRTLPAAKRRVLEKVLAQYVHCSELREITRMSMITSIWLVRGVVYEVGRQLVQAGVLRSLDEVAYLDFEDVLRFLGGTADIVDAFPRERLEQARRTSRHQRSLPEPPLTLIGDHDPTDVLPPATDGDRIEGLGASPGRVVGRARVIEDLVWQADEFEAGDILVTRFTDASWTPLFALAGGVVTDVGSMLSHSSIVSREFGVPSVVNTKFATSRITTGDLVVVDGTAGVVELIRD